MRAAEDHAAAGGPCTRRRGVAHAKGTCGVRASSEREGNAPEAALDARKEASCMMGCGFCRVMQLSGWGWENEPSDADMRQLSHDTLTLACERCKTA